MSSIFGKSALSPEWVERFREIVKLNAYAQSTPVRLSGVVIEGYDLSGAKLSGAEFEKTEWKNITLKSGEFINAKFIHSSFDNVKFENATFKDTVFEDVTFDDFAFFQAQLQNVRFVRCQFSGAALQSLKASTITIEDSKLEDVSFFRSAVIATVRGSKFNEVDMRSLQEPSALTFEKSELKEVDFSDSKLSELKLREVTASKSGMEGGAITSGEFIDTTYGMDIVEVEFEQLVIRNSRIRSAMNRSSIKRLEISHCGEMKDFLFYQSKLGNVRIDHCELRRLDLPSATVETLHIQDGSLINGNMTSLRVGSMTLERMSFDGKIDFTKAQAGSISLVGVTKLPGLQLITTGSNVAF